MYKEKSLLRRNLEAYLGAFYIVAFIIAFACLVSPGFRGNMMMALEGAKFLFSDSFSPAWRL